MKTHIARCQYLDAGHIRHFTFNEIYDAVEYARTHISPDGTSNVVNDAGNLSFVSPCSDKTVRDAVKMSKNMANHCPGLTLVLAEHCNMSCKGCVAGATLVDKPKFADVNDVDRTLNKLHALCGPEHEPTHVFMFGGEPTLHPRLAEIVDMTRHYFPTTMMMLCTNGTLLPKLPTRTLDTLKDCKCNVMLSVYSNATIFECIKYSHTPQDHGDTWCNYKPNTVRVVQDERGHVVVTDTSTSLFPNGDLLFCVHMHAAYIMHTHGLVKNLLIPGKDFVNVHELQSFTDIEDFFSLNRIPFCVYCRPVDIVHEHWSQVGRQTADEWFV